MARLGKKSKKKFDYYDAFDKQAAIALKEAKLLREAVSEFKSADDLETYIPRAHALEKEGDGVCHSVFDALLPDFVTPIDREDIIALSESLDELTDKIEEVLQRFYMYDIHFMHNDMEPFAKLLVESCKALCEAMADFRNCKKSDKFHSLIVRVNDLEDEADVMHVRLIRKLYTVDRDRPVRAQVWSSIFDLMEECIDQCEDIANLMNSIMVKYG